MLFLYIVFLLFVIGYDIIRKKNVFIDFLRIFNLFFVFTYLLPPILFLSDPTQYGNWRFLSVVPQAAGSVFVFLVIAIGYLSIITGFHAGQMLPNKQTVRLEFTLSEKWQFRIVFIYFLFSMLCFFLYAYGHGGLIELILSGKDIRGNRADAELMQYFGVVARGLNSSMLFFFSFSLLSQYRGLRSISKKMFILSFFLALINAIGTAGRGNIGMVFIYLLFLWFNVKRPKLSKSNFMLITIFVLFIFFLVTYGKSAIWSLTYLNDGPATYINAVIDHKDRYVSLGGDDAYDYLIGFARNMDHPVVSAYTSLNKPEVYQSYRLFFDWIRAILDILPGVQTPELFVSSTPSALNREFLGVEGYVPPGWIAMKIINGGVLWLFFGSVLAGIIGGYINRFLILNFRASPLVPATFLIMGFFWKDNIVSPDPFMVFLPNLSVLMMFFLISLVFKIKKTSTLFASGVSNHVS